MARLNPRRRRKKREQLAKNEAILRGEFWSPSQMPTAAELNRIWNEMFDNVRIANAPEPETKSEA